MKLLIILSIIISFVLGAVTSAVFYKNKIENINEDIVSDEMKLVSLAINSTTPCDKLLQSTDWVYENYGEYEVFWKLYADQTMIAKLIVAHNVSSVVETFDNNCPLK